MKLINFFFLAVSILLPMKSYSQDLSLSLEDLIPGGKTYNKYRAEMPRRISWYGDKLIYVKGDSVMVAPNTDSETPQTLLTLKEID
ncbi:MAG: S9 family peptidase, partial [Prevotella sp.]|nr:S9 family peptidase [Prevotella sp.]